MEEKQFRELLRIVKDEDVWTARKREVEAVLRELLAGEFKEIKERKFKVVLKRLDGIASTFSNDGTAYISINSDYWEKHPTFGETGLRSVLAHELLHALSGLRDEDPRFKVEARQRGIDIWNY